MPFKEKPEQNVWGEVILQWQMPEYPHQDKGQGWYMTAGVIVLAIIAYGLITAEYIMAIAFALLAGVYYILHNEAPKNITVSITTLGIVIEKDFYQFSDIESFWIVYVPPKVRLFYLRPAKKWSSDIKLELMDQNPMVLRQLLQPYIKELPGQGESLIDKISRVLKL
jgi:hypothetical protein